LAVAALPAQQRLLVPSQYPTLAAAVAAANDGDTVELATGAQNTGGATITKTLNIVGTNTTLYGTLTITIPAGKALSMSGCTCGFADLRVMFSAGRVTLADGPHGWGNLTIVNSAQVLLRNFGFDTPIAILSTSHPGFVQNSNVSIDNCVFRGFAVLAGTYNGATHALELVNSNVNIANSSLFGGMATITSAGRHRAPAP